MTVQSYNGNLDFGFIACRELVPDLWSLVDYLHESPAGAAGLDRHRPPPPRRRPPRSKAAAKKAAAKRPAKKAAAKATAKRAKKAAPARKRAPVKRAASR